MMHRTKQLFCCMLALILLAAALPAFAETAAGGETYTAYVIANTMKVYQYPSPLSRLMGTMSYGESVKVLSWQDRWFKLQNSKGQIGYCPYGGLSLENPNNLDMFGYVKEAGAYVHAKPGLAYKVIATATMGDEMHVVGMTRDKQWLRVKNGSKYGYVQTELMSKTPTWFGNGLTLQN